jgi:hypothetical protein
MGDEQPDHKYEQNGADDVVFVHPTHDQSLRGVRARTARH